MKEQFFWMLVKKQYSPTLYIAILGKCLQVFKQLLVIHIVGYVSLAPECFQHVCIQMVIDIVLSVGDGVIVYLLRLLEQLTNFFHVCEFLTVGSFPDEDTATKEVRYLSSSRNFHYPNLCTIHLYWI